MSRLIIPILNSTASLLPGPSHYLDNETRIDKLNDAEFGLVSKTPAEYAGRFRTEHRCIFIDFVAGADLESAVSQTATRLRFVLNNFMSHHPLLLEFAVYIERSGIKNQYGKPRLVNLGEDPSTLLKSETPFKVHAGTKREDMSQFYALVGEACAKYKRLYLTLSRFNSALTRAKLQDKIIDATISLESMVQDDKNELSFKFALYNAFAATKDPAKRMENFELLKKLYNTRSSIVHGANDEAKELAMVTNLSTSWKHVEDITRRAINEFVFFTRDHDPKTWTKHLLEQIVVPPTILPIANAEK